VARQQAELVECCKGTPPVSGDEGRPEGRQPTEQGGPRFGNASRSTGGLWWGGFPYVSIGASKRALNYRGRPPLIKRALPRGAFSRPHTPSGGPSSPLQPSETGHFFLLVPLRGPARRQGAPGQPAVAHHPARQPETEFHPLSTTPVRSPRPGGGKFKRLQSLVLMTTVL
jgi:hypothetical protein